MHIQAGPMVLDVIPVEQTVQAGDYATVNTIAINDIK